MRHSVFLIFGHQMSDVEEEHDSSDYLGHMHK